MGKSYQEQEKDYNEIFSVGSNENIKQIKGEIAQLLPNDIRVKAHNESQKKLIRSIKNNEITISAGPPGCGKTFVSVAYALNLLRKTTNRYKKIYLVKSVTTLKGEEIGFLKGPQPLYEKVLTPDGWKKINEININDLVINKNGNPVKVKNITNFDENDVYRITLKDGRYVDCDLKHLWNVRTNKLDFFTVNTEFILNHINKVNFYLPRLKPVKFDKNIDNELSPYLLGVLIGDGCFTHSHIRFTSIDNEIIDKVKRICHEEYGIKLSKNNISYNLIADKTNIKRGGRIIKLTNTITNETFYGSLSEVKKHIKYKLKSDSAIYKRCYKNLVVDNIKYEFSGEVKPSNNIVREYLHKYELFGKKSWEKFIPEIYKFSTIENRFELLRGLLDTDGTVKKNGEITYTTTSIKLANDIKEIVLSLGGSARIYTPRKKKKIQKLNNVEVKERRQLYTIYIKFFEKENNPFFLKRKAKRFKPLDDYSLKIVNVEKTNKIEKMKCLTIDDEDSLYVTKDYILTHNSLKEKIEPFMWSFFINMEKLINTHSMRVLLEKDIIRPFPLAYMRGASLDDCIIISDEMQNVSLDNSRTLLTRIGSNCKLILLGDINQVDMKNKGESSLPKLLKMFEDVEGFGVINMSEKDTNVRNPLISVIEENYKDYINSNGNGK